MTSKSDRGLILRTKLLIPERVWRIATRPASWVLGAMPEQLKYKMGLRARKASIPYSLIETDDVVVQIGAPADLLKVGRSRSAYFMNLVSGNGKLVVMEPDSDNCRAMEAYGARNGFSDRLIVVNAGAWSSDTTLSFYESKKHPASAVMVELSEATPEEMRRRGYHRVDVPVTTVDKVFAEHGLPLPKVISITTNGAELEILRGMSDMLAKGGPEYISLAVTGDRYAESMVEFGYEYLGDDDRGFTFRRVANS